MALDLTNLSFLNYICCLSLTLSDSPGFPLEVSRNVAVEKAFCIRIKEILLCTTAFLEHFEKSATVQSIHEESVSNRLCFMAYQPLWVINAKSFYTHTHQSAGVVEYTDCFSAEG